MNVRFWIYLIYPHFPHWSLLKWSIYTHCDCQLFGIPSINSKIATCTLTCIIQAVALDVMFSIHCNAAFRNTQYSTKVNSDPWSDSVFTVRIMHVHAVSQEASRQWEQKGAMWQCVRLPQSSVVTRPFMQPVYSTALRDGKCSSVCVVVTKEAPENDSGHSSYKQNTKTICTCGFELSGNSSYNLYKM